MRVLRTRRPRWQCCSSAGIVAALSLILIAIGALISPRVASPPSEVEQRPLDEPALLDALALPSSSAAPTSIAELRERVAAILEREQVPGVGLALVDRSGVIWAGGVGVADRRTQRPVDADTVFRVASISKSVVALGVMRLVEQGRLDLDEPLAQRMPEIELHNPWAATAPISLAHALEHTAGFDDMRFNEWWGPEGMRPREALAINPRSRVSRWRPGRRMAYSNPGYTIAGHAIELATREPWDAWLEREVLRPLGMATASFRRTPELRERLATGYLDPEQAVEFQPFAHAPAGALLASPLELGALVHACLRRGVGDDGPIVSAASFDRIEQTKTATHPITDVNYGLGNYGDVLHPVRGRGHDGGLPGFLSVYRYFPELGVGYVVLLNSTHSLRAYVEIRVLMFAYLARGRELPAPPIAPPDEDRRAADSGYYAFANPRVELFGFVERLLLGLELRAVEGGDAAELELLTGGVIRLVPTGDGGYRQPHEGGTSVRVGRDAIDQTRALVIGMGQFEAASKPVARARLLALQAATLAMQLALAWLLGCLTLAAIRRLRGRGRLAAMALHVWPAIASLSFALMLTVGSAMAARQAFNTANAWSIGFYLTTLLVPACSAAALVSCLRGANRRAAPIWARLIPTAAAIACFGMTLWLLGNGVIGLRVWAW